MAGPVPKYGAKYDPRGTLVTGADGKDYLFGSVADAYRPGPPAPTTPPPQVFDATPSQYDAPTMAALQQISAQRQRIERERAENPPMSMRDAIAGDDHVADQIGGTEPDSPRARLEEIQRVRDNPGAAAKTFTRSAAVGALDTAALPVTVPARIARAARDSAMDATGERTGLDTAADLSADEALQDATWLASGEDAGAYRARVAEERLDYPSVAGAGAELGSAVAMAPLGAIAATERGLAGRALRSRGGLAARAGAQAPASVQQQAYAENRQAGDAEVLGAAGTWAGTALALTRDGLKRDVVYRNSDKAARSAEKAWGKKALSQAELERTFGVSDDVKSAFSPKDRKLDFYIDESLDDPSDSGAFGLRVKGTQGHGVAPGDFEYVIRPKDQTAYLALVQIPAEHRSKGLTRSMLAAQTEAFERLKVKRVALTAAGDGVVVWPKLGFRPAPEVEAGLVGRFNAQFPDAQAATIEDIARAGGHGEKFLRAQGEIDMSTPVSDLRARVSPPPARELPRTGTE